MLPRACSGALYDALELSPDCTSGDVKRQYRKLALQYHPDRTGGTTTERFQDIERANHVLSSTVSRRLYDQFGSNGLQLVNTDTDDLEVQLSSAVRRLQTVFAIAFVLLASLFVSACVACHLADASWGRGTVDGPKGPSSLAWSLTFIPVYVACLPTFLVAAGLAIFSFSSCSLLLFLWSFEAFMSIAIVGTSVAALTGRTTAVAAITTWMTWYAMRTMRKLFLILPPVFAQEIAEAQAAAQAAAHHEHPTLDEDSNQAAVARMSMAQVMCLGGYWFGAVLPTLVEWSCVWSFLGMCLRRAMSSEDMAASSLSSRAVKTGNLVNGQLSFWVIFTPLIVLVCLRVVLKVIVIACFSSSIPAPATHADAVVVEGTTTAAPTGATDSAAANTTHVTGVFVGTDGAVPPSPSCCDIVSSTITFSIPELSLLWMACGWAATADRLFNMHQPPQRFYQTAWMASLPLLAMLLFPTMLALALLIAVATSGRALFGLDHDPYADNPEMDDAAFGEGAASGTTSPNNNNNNNADRNRAPLATKGPSTPNYQSTGARPSNQDGLADVD